MRAIIDTCIIIDALQNRVPFSTEAQAIFLLCANQKYEGFLTAKAMTDIYYLTHRHTHNDQATRKILSKLCTLFHLVDTSSIDIRNALLSETSDFEDAVMIETAIRSNVDCIVTRNTKDYKNAALPIYTPADFISLLSSEEI